MAVLGGASIGENAQQQAAAEDVLVDALDDQRSGSVGHGGSGSAPFALCGRASFLLIQAQLARSL